MQKQTDKYTSINSQSKKVGLEFALKDINILCCSQVFVWAFSRDVD